MKLNFIALVLVIFTLSSCGPSKLSDKELALDHLNKAERCFSKNELNAAKLQLDTINKQFPKEVATRKKADMLFTRIQLLEQKRNLVYADSLVIIKQVEFDSIAKNFNFEKDEKYEDVGNYIYKKQGTEENAGRTYIKPLVEETGMFILSSLYCSVKPIKHNHAKFSVGDLFAETEVVPEESGYNYSFKDGNATFETVIYRSNSNEAIANFVQQNANKPILVTLTGAKGKMSYTLSSNEKKAISEAYNLSIVLKDLQNLKRIIKSSKKKILIFESYLAQQ